MASPRDIEEEKAWKIVDRYRLCPRAVWHKIYKITPRRRSSPTQLWLYRCAICRTRFTIRADMLFARSHIPLSKWFRAIELLCASTKGVTARQLQSELGISYKAARVMLTRIREVMGKGQVSLAAQLRAAMKKGNWRRHDIEAMRLGHRRLSFFGLTFGTALGCLLRARLTSGWRNPPPRQVRS